MDSKMTRYINLSNAIQKNFLRGKMFLHKGKLEHN